MTVPIEKNLVSILIINGSVRGADGNSGAIARKAAQYCKERTIGCSTLTLAGPLPDVAEVAGLVSQHHAFLILSGVYWNSCGSPLQRFIEVMTAYENSPAFFGKPVACAVSMDSVGGSDVANRLHGVFNGFGCWSPPCSTLIISRTATEAIAASNGKTDDPNEDVWRLDDLEIVMDNLVIASGMKAAWKQWSFSPLKAVAGPWPATGSLYPDANRFV